MFTYFKGSGKSGVFACTSEDGLKWKKLNGGKAIIVPMQGTIMRDPCLYLDKYGTYHLVWTGGSKSTVIGYCSSKDLKTWTDQKFMQLFPDTIGVRNCWAPEIIFNEKENQFMIYWSTTIPGRFPETDNTGDNGFNHRIYYTLTADFNTFTKAELLYEPGYNVIDATINPVDTGFVMFIKNETRRPAEKNIRWAFSEAMTGPYSSASAPITGNYWAEGPTAIKIDDAWHLYFDKYTLSSMGLKVSKNLVDWRSRSTKLRMPLGIRHGTVLRVPPECIRSLE
jgi:sucrose-6-phosphate hydrolase SacC (GH32 family)